MLRNFILILFTFLLLIDVSILSAQTSIRTIKFQLQGVDTRDEFTSTDNAIQFYFHPNAQNGWDIYDASKLTPLGSRYATISLLGERLGEEREKSQDSRPYYLAENIVVESRSKYLQVTGSFTLSINELDNVPEHWEIKVRDVIADSTINLRESNYEFDYTIATGSVEQEERFHFIINTNAAPENPVKLNTAGWHFIGPMVSNVTMNDLAAWGNIQGVSGFPFANAAPNIYTSYDGENWQAPNSGDLLQPGDGFIWYLFSGAEYEISYNTNNLSYGNKSISLHSDGDKWNLLANPFPYPFDIRGKSAMEGNIPSDVVSIWDIEAQTYRLSSDLNHTIQAGQAFFLLNDDAESLFFPQSMQIVSDANLNSMEDYQHATFRILAYGIDKNGETTARDYATNIIFSESELRMTSKNPPAFSGMLQWAIRGDDGLYYSQFESQQKESDTFSLVLKNQPEEVEELVLRFESPDNLDYRYLDIPEIGEFGLFLDDIEWKDFFVPPSIEELSLVFHNGNATHSESSQNPVATALFPGYPNPFNPTTTIPYQLSESQFVSLQVFDITGRLITNLVQEHQSAGQHFATWNADGFASGLYLVRLRVGEQTFTQRVSLVK